MNELINACRISDPEYIAECKATLDSEGVLVLKDFFTSGLLETVIDSSVQRIEEAFYTTSTHNVYLTPVDSSLPSDHVFNQQIASSKGCLADDQVEANSPLRSVYDSDEFRSFVAQVVGVDLLHPYDDDLSSINVHFHRDGQELGWHFDNSSFAVTALIQAPEAGGAFQYVANLRDSAAADNNYCGVASVLDGSTQVQTLEMNPGDLVVFRGRDSMHRVTPSQGETTRILVVFAYNTEPGIGLSESAKETFYGRN